MHGAELIGVAVLGLILGSFTTALSYRVPRGESTAAGRSRCPACGHTLGIADLVPVVSWLSSRGRCRHCSTAISWRYPVIELATMGLIVAGAALADNPAHLMLLLIMTPVMVALAVIDFEHKQLPDQLTAVLAVLALAWRAFGDGDFLTAAATAVVVAAIGVGLDLLMRAFGGSVGLGLGDTKLFAVAGLALPLGPFLFFTLTAGLLGFFMGLVWLVRCAGPGFPFGPAILLGLWLGLTWGERALQRLLAVVGA